MKNVFDWENFEATGFVLLAAFSILFLVLAILLALGKARSLGPRLVLLGLVTAFAAIWYGYLTGDKIGLPPMFQTSTVGRPDPVGRSNEQGLAVTASATSFAASLMKIAVILVIGGVGVSMWTQANPPAAPDSREKAHAK